MWSLLHMCLHLLLFKKSLSCCEYFRSIIPLFFVRYPVWYTAKSHFPSSHFGAVGSWGRRQGWYNDCWQNRLLTLFEAWWWVNACQKVKMPTTWHGNPVMTHVLPTLSLSCCGMLSCLPPLTCSRSQAFIHQTAVTAFVAALINT